VFKNCSSATKITFSKVNKIGADVFSGCSSLESVEIPSAIKELSAGTFRDCHGLKSADVSSLTVIPDRLFFNCYALSDVKLSKSITSIGKEAFRNTAITAYEFPATLISIGDSAFQGTKLTTANIQGVKEIGDYVFKDCEQLKNVTLPANVTSIGMYAFYNTAIETIAIPDGVTYLPTNVFAKCTALKSINLNKVTEIGYRAFEGCTALKTVDLGDVTKIGGYAFIRCYALESIDLTGVKTVKNDAFHGCISLKSVNLGKDLVAIEDSAFFNCVKLETVTGSLENLTLLGCLNSHLLSIETVKLPDSVEEFPNYEEIVQELKDFSNSYKSDYVPFEPQ